MPTQDSSGGDQDSKSGEQAASERDQDAWVLDFALRRTMQYGKEFSDEKPLVGEPGKLRYSTTKDQPGNLNPNKTGASRLPNSRAPTPMQSRATSTVPR